MVVNRTIRSLGAAALLLLLGALTAGCSAEPTPDLLSVELFASPDAASPFDGVGFMVVRVKGEDLNGDLLSVADYVDGAPGDAPLPTIPYSPEGLARQIVVEGWAATEAGDFSHLVSVGRSPWLVISETDEEQTIHVQMARINSFVPLTEVHTRTSQSLVTGRVGHTVTHTVKGETVIAGGGVPLNDGSGSPWWTRDGLGGFLSSVEIVDGVTQAAAIHAAPQEGGTVQSGLFFPRAWHSATALPTGQIFFAGGWSEVNGGRDALSFVEWYEPSGAIAVLQQPLAKARAGHTATLVDPNPDRFTILFVGGDADGEGTYELWSPVTGSSGAVTLPDLLPRRFHAAVAAPVLDDNDNPMDAVVIFGGEADGEPLATGLFFVVPTETMMVHPASLSKGARTQLTGTYVEAQNYIYLIGGHTDTEHTAASSAIEVYDTHASSWQQPFLAGTETFNLITPRGGHSTSLVGDSMLVILGGSIGQSSLDRVEIIHEYLEKDADTNTVTPTIQVVHSCFEADCSSPVPAMPEARDGHQAVVLDRGSILVAGGASGSHLPSQELIHELDLYYPQ